METDGFTNKPRNWEEFAMSVRHAKYITSRFAHSDMGMSAYREKVPGAVKNAYKGILKAVGSGTGRLTAVKEVFNMSESAKILKRENTRPTSSK